MPGNETTTIGGHCPICGDPISAPVQCCPRCETPHHLDCWQYNEGCAVYGCRGHLLVLRSRPTVQPLAREVTTTGAAVAPGVPRWKAVCARLATADQTVWFTLGAMIFLFTFLAIVSFATVLFDSALLTLLLFLCLGLGGMLMAGSHHVMSLFAQFAKLDVDEMECGGEPLLKTLMARLDANPKNYNLLESAAWQHYVEAQYETARQLYRRALELRPEHQQTLYQLGRCSQLLGDLDGARHAFTKALARDEESQVGSKARWWLTVLDKREKQPAAEQPAAEPPAAETPTVDGRQ